MDPIEAFKSEVRANIAALKGDADLQAKSLDWSVHSSRHKYDYNFRWMGRPIIQLPQDMVAMQELIWEIKPDLIIETGIAHGGSAVFYASMLQLLGNGGRVVAVDIDIREHNRRELEQHPMFPHMTLIEGSSVDESVVAHIHEEAQGAQRVLVALDSNHTHEHVLAEMEVYAGLVTPGSYLVVFDTVIDDFPADFFPNRPWGPGNSPKSAVKAFLASHPEFVIDEDLEAKLQLTVCPSGYLRRLEA